MIALPDNIFTKIFAEIILSEHNQDYTFVSSSLVLNNLVEDKCDIAFIPSLEILQHKDLFISSKTAVSFDGLFSNQFLYFKENDDQLNDIYLRGDVSKNDIILSKILFKEKFGTEINLVIDTKRIETGSKNYLITGNENFENDYYLNGISFCDQVCDLLEAPYVNYVAASKSSAKLIEFNKIVVDADKLIEDNFDKLDLKISEKLKTEILRNLNSVYFEMTEIEQDSLKEMIRICFYQGIIEDLFEVNFV